MDLKQPYLKEQIFAYIGNKRKLLGLIYEAISKVYDGCIPSGLRFIDPFAGSGVVSRLAKLLNFEVHSNDWEEYSFITNSAFLSIDKSDILDLFNTKKQLHNLLDHFNNLPEPQEDDQYIAKYFAPISIDNDNVDFRKERLCYTRKNALAIDKIRNEIDKLFPPHNMSEKNQKIRQLQIALLLYEAATHSNTNGLFKGYHKGFGGHGKDALKRILAPIKLRYPCLCDSEYPCFVYKEDANVLVKDKSLGEFDVAYLDPPYREHQYGSNYHILHKIAVWDKMPAPLELNRRGELKYKAGIGKDWEDTKSDYCYRGRALAAFEDLIKSIRAHYIILSYSTDGFIPFEEVRDICSNKGDVSILANEYVKYRGGKQSNKRVNLNIEYVLIINSKKKVSPKSLTLVNKTIMLKRVLLLFKKRYSKSKLIKYFNLVKSDESIERTIHGKKIKINTQDFFELIPPDEINAFSLRVLTELYKSLSLSVTETKEEELQEIMNKLNGNVDKNNYYIKFIPNTLKKLANKTNKDKFFLWLSKVKNIEKRYPEPYSLIKEKLCDVEEQANKRFKN